MQRKEIAATRPVDQILAAEEKEAEMPSKAAGERQNSLASFGPGEDNKPLDLAAEPSTGCETKVSGRETWSKTSDCINITCYSSSRS